MQALLWIRIETSLLDIHGSRSLMFATWTHPPLIEYQTINHKMNYLTNDKIDGKDDPSLTRRASLVSTV